MNKLQILYAAFIIEPNFVLVSSCRYSYKYTNTIDISRVSDEETWQYRTLNCCENKPQYMLLSETAATTAHSHV